MKVLLVYPQVLNHPNHPMGLLYIAAVLEKEGHEVMVLDPRNSYDYEKFSSEVYDFKPDVVGFTCTTPQVNLAYRLAKRIRSISNAKIIFGGVHPSVLPYEVIKEDFVEQHVPHLIHFPNLFMKFIFLLTMLCRFCIAFFF